MSTRTTDRTGAEVVVGLDESTVPQSYSAVLADGSPAGNAFFVDAPDGARIFHHTVVPEELGGRGLGGILVTEALADSIRRDTAVVPLCPFFARHLEKHGDEFIAGGGRFRAAEEADIAAVRAAEES
ncbi:N-acetyltransferase [Brevibacterium album]|uniref:N-acetyltransferase n=1 Tax=Brevibacterium album TaxID=417948 RepID=UPI0003F50522|nr:N-acetyltransferase [Brevibacterium album]